MRELTGLIRPDSTHETCCTDWMSHIMKFRILLHQQTNYNFVSAVSKQQFCKSKAVSHSLYAKLSQAEENKPVLMVLYLYVGLGWNSAVLKIHFQQHDTTQDGFTGICLC